MSLSDPVLKAAYLETDQNHIELGEKTFLKRLNTFRELITVEPVAFLALFSSYLALITSQTLALQKACRVNLNFSDEICDSLLMQDQSNNFSSYERLVQEYYSTQLLWKTVLQTVFPCTLLLFIGGWSDKTGRRKVVLLIPLVGETLNAISNIINVILFYQLPLQALMFLEVFFIYITGGLSVTTLGLLNYICDITTAENRTHRLGVITILTYVSTPVGISLSGIIFKRYGYYAIYGTVFSINMVTLLYITYRLKDPPRSKEQMQYDGKGTLNFLRTFFDLSSITDTIKVLCKKTTDNRRLRLCVLLAVAILLYGPVFGEIAVVYMAVRYRFGWDEVIYSVFQTYNFIINAIGTIISITFLSKYLKCHDSVMGIISSLSRIASAFVFCFAPNDKIFFIGPFIDMFTGTALLAIRSIYSKILDPNEIGKFSSLMGLIENLTPLAYVPIYTQVYTATMDTLPGAVYLVGAALTIPGVFVFVWLLWQHKKGV